MPNFFLLSVIIIFGFHTLTNLLFLFFYITVFKSGLTGYGRLLLSGFLGNLDPTIFDEIFDDDAKCIVNMPQVSYHLLSLALGSEMVDRQLRISINIFVDIVEIQRVSHLNNIRSKSNK
jgi:hypothetical protein